MTCWNQITIDGPAASGKSSIGKAVAEKINWFFLSSGQIYRAIALAYFNLEKSSLNFNKSKLTKFIRCLNLKIHENGISVNEKKLTSLFDPKINETLRLIANQKSIRAFINKHIINYAQKNNVIVEGRDIGSKVLTNAFLKIYIDADINTRALRRFQQQGEKKIISIETIQKQINDRDDADKNRKIDPLVIPSNAIIIDTTNLTFDETVEKIITIFKEKYNA